MTVITKPSEKKEQKAPLVENEKLPEVTVTQPKETITIVTKKRVVRQQRSGDSACSTICTFLIVTGIVIGLSYFSLHIYKRKWLQQKQKPWMEQSLARKFEDPVDQSEPVNNQRIAAISVYILFNGPVLIFGGFDNLNRIKTQTEMDKKTVIAHETHEVAQYFETPYMTAMTYEYDEEMKTLEMLQMPELSSGRYVHDFFKKKTLIVDSDNSRCFITSLDEEQIREPTSMCQMFKDIEKDGVYKMDLEEVSKKTYAIEIPAQNVTSTEYGCPIATMSRNECDKNYILKDIHDEILDEILDNDSEEIRLVRKKRSIEDTSKEFNFVEFTGKSLLKYDIVNVDL